MSRNDESRFLESPLLSLKSICDELPLECSISFLAAVKMHKSAFMQIYSVVSKFKRIDLFNGSDHPNGSNGAGSDPDPSRHHTEKIKTWLEDLTKVDFN